VRPLCGCGARAQCGLENKPGRLYLVTHHICFIALSGHKYQVTQPWRSRTVTRNARARTRHAIVRLRSHKRIPAYPD
jgi:hypothetical protein